jgi:hypothetical protein
VVEVRSVLSDVIGHQVRPDGIKVWEFRDWEPVIWWDRWVCVCGWSAIGDPSIPQWKWQGWHDSEIKQEVAARILLAAYEEGER